MIVKLLNYRNTKRFATTFIPTLFGIVSPRWLISEAGKCYKV